MGGLMLLEGSHKLENLKASYGSTDVDRYCSDEGDADSIIARARAQGRDLTRDEQNSIEWHSSGAYSTDPVAVRHQFETRWLTAKYEMGDVLVFTLFTMHAASDNQTNLVRLSTDTRYQLASEPADGRWVGENPPKHGINAKQSVIC
jgi:ectoine hydroxylase-related dioxygenase (phytanoyl-CoA dioxygenase family)